MDLNICQIGFDTLQELGSDPPHSDRPSVARFETISRSTNRKRHRLITESTCEHRLVDCTIDLSLVEFLPLPASFLPETASGVLNLSNKRVFDKRERTLSKDGVLWPGSGFNLGFTMLSQLLMILSGFSESG